MTILQVTVSQMTVSPMTILPMTVSQITIQLTVWKIHDVTIDVTDKF